MRDVFKETLIKLRLRLLRNAFDNFNIRLPYPLRLVYLSYLPSKQEPEDH